jgi:hypothetical protein
MRRRLVVVPMLLGGLATAGLGSGASAGPGPHPPRLSGKDLPSVAQMSVVYPELAGGRRDVARTHTFDANAGRDCISVRTLGRPSRALWASYYTASGDDPYFQGGESAAPFVHKFATRRAARLTMRKLHRYVVRCEGRHHSDGTRNHLEQLAPPALGDDTVGYQISWRYPNVITGSSTRRELHVVVRNGRRVVDVFLQAESYVPSLDHAVQVADLSLQATS